MQDVRVDEAGDFRCWNCGGKNFISKRTARAKVAVGVGALLTHKKLKCQACGEYNQTGAAKPFDPDVVGKKLAKPQRSGSKSEDAAFKQRMAEAAQRAKASAQARERS
jgi:hypothetical protein